MSLVHLWWVPEHALCGSTELGHDLTCRVGGTWQPSWDDVCCLVCGVALCRDCMRISAGRYGYPLSEIPLLRVPLAHVVSV